jgi:hypothetical protein
MSRLNALLVLLIYVVSSVNTFVVRFCLIFFLPCFSLESSLNSVSAFVLQIKDFASALAKTFVRNIFPCVNLQQF